MIDNNIEGFKQEYECSWGLEEQYKIPVKMDDIIVILEYLPPRCMQMSIIKDNEYATIKDLDVRDSIEILNKLPKDYRNLLLDVGRNYYNIIRDELPSYFCVSSATREDIKYMNKYHMTYIGLYSYQRQLEYCEKLLEILK